MARQRRTEAFWQRHVAAFEASGRTRGGYCAAHGLSGSTLDDWRRRLRSERDGTTGKTSSAAFVPVQVEAATPVPDSDQVAAVLDWPCGMRMRVARGADPMWLSQVLSGLR